ncbi:dihydrofolate reductase [Radiobacillus kanasensis]|uniref:dihydrofolate reductase n=1 Tax=Radiobacillus kanasensis TaxID=2844358 RepID=UPI001E5C35A9|nr:dihydrofolate reductase [Radiobacillus kanasensis]UFU01251.1 dihydrofolate reductase [Radiobacillus kanasensis]
MLSFLVAMDKNSVIGRENDLPWRLPKDLKFFKELTTSHTVIMGRNTFDSMGKPLPNRTNVVVTRNTDYEQEGCIVIHSLDTILEWQKESPDQEYFIIGGGKIFEQMLPHADRMYITYIDEVFEGDTYFPNFDSSKWVLTSEKKGEKDEKNPYDYYFRQYDRI